MDTAKVLRIALVIAVISLAVNFLTMVTPLQTYGIDSFVLAAMMGVLAYVFKNDERFHSYWIICLVVAAFSIGAGVMSIVGAR